MFFKYRSLSSGNSLSRLEDMIHNHRLFFPDRGKLNDPFEGLVNHFKILGYAGAWYPSITDQESPFLSEKRNEYKILSLSSDCFSPLMWAHYADEGCGLCLCFLSNGSFSKAQPVIYSSQEIIKSDQEIALDHEIEDKIYAGFFKKHADWSYEKEWRIVQKTNDKYYSYRKNELVAVIFGHKIDDGNKRIINRMLPPKVKRFVIHIGGQSGRIKLLRDGYMLPGDGSEPTFICALSELCDAIIID